MRNIYSKVGEKNNVKLMAEMKKRKEYENCLIDNIIDNYLDLFEFGLNNGFSDSYFDTCDYYKKKAVSELNEILFNTPFGILEKNNELYFLPVKNKMRVDYFNYLMYLKYEYENKEEITNNNCKRTRVLNPERHSDR